ncbi:MAG TPA: flagellar motor protein MotB [Ignavibacteriales bacterium]|nr:flagellar motor protein MotB [Ignavibacteriales bacterium]
MNGSDNNPIIIVKKKKGGAGGHGGAWKVAYADFVTAMMALFIELWVLGQNDEVKKAVAGYFKDPANYSIAPGIGAGLMPNNSPELMDKEIIERLERKKTERERLEEMGDRIKEELSADPEFEQFMDKVEFEIVDEGLRMEIMETREDVFFEIGTSKMKGTAIELLNKIGYELSKMPNKIVIEGHTDSRPYSDGNKGYTNFELSADRANSARRALTDGGLSASQIDEIRGYADKRLRNSENPYDLVNRRISIIVKYINN